MKKWTQVALALFFVLINTFYFWEPEFILLTAFIGIVLFAVFCYFLYLWFKLLAALIYKRFAEGKKLRHWAVLTIVLLFTTLFPTGAIPWGRITEGKPILVAQYEGSANCTNTLLLFENNRCKIRSICFGIKTETGRYIARGDTLDIMIEGDTAIRHALIYPDSTSRYAKNGLVHYFSNDPEQRPLPLAIFHNEFSPGKALKP